jgi:hypothetical protein
VLVCWSPAGAVASIVCVHSLLPASAKPGKTEKVRVGHARCSHLRPAERKDGEDPGGRENNEIDQMVTYAVRVLVVPAAGDGWRA